MKALKIKKVAISDNRTVTIAAPRFDHYIEWSSVWFRNEPGRRLSDALTNIKRIFNKHAGNAHVFGIRKGNAPTVDFKTENSSLEDGRKIERWLVAKNIDFIIIDRIDRRRYSYYTIANPKTGDMAVANPNTTTVSDMEAFAAYMCHEQRLDPIGWNTPSKGSFIHLMRQSRRNGREGYNFGGCL